MAQGFNAANFPQIDPTSPKKFEKTITKPVHPEMIDVKPGEQLMGVTFQQELPPEKIDDPRFKLDSPELHNLTPPPTQEELHQSLRDRIDELNDDEDDDGDVPALIKR